MKKVVLGALIFGLMSSAHAVKTSGTGQIGSGNINNLVESDFSGSYIVGRLAIEGPYYVVQFQVNEAGDRVVFRDANMDNVSADNNCVGDSMKLKNNILDVAVYCKSAGETLRFQIDVTGVSKEDLAKGADVQVRSAATMNQWIPFKIIKRNKSFF
ncbi:MAG: hypothetical protein OM95_10395 [Bdellovibrio sp. ArHS]|uniref:hypothetical protein n=1 Tax=Bdellovibrio sp. ArHS TaxID=1569284 RepID=UPI0005829AB6|nr:hypothetical protein [Bdellovibrio sp. ArHS]KHD88170.1 MAG: hypothetical protein OM95_10395 [Bdellovibrio sp. ArHS]